MKTLSKKLLSMFLSLTLLTSAMLLAPITALAVDDPGTLDSKYIEFWADPENTLKQEDITAYKNGDKTTMVGAVAVHKRSGSSSNYYLFLPSNADCNNLKLWFTATSASVDGIPVTNGEASSVFSAINAGEVRKTYTVTLDGTSYSVTAIKSGDVGAVYIDTESGTIANINNSSDKSVSESGTILVTQPNGKVDFDGALDKMKGRGNATWSAKGKKNPYNIKIGKKTSLLGMGKSKKWCLIANAGDDTLIKNQMTYDFSKYIGINYQVVGKPVDLYVNQQYVGSYLLTEKVEIGSGRIDGSDAYENLEEANAYTDPETGKKITDLEGRDISEIKEFKDENGTAASSDSFTANKNAQQIGMRKYSPGLTSPEDVTGGYLYELEISNRWEDEGAGFCGYNRQGWVVKSCDYASKDMVNYSYDLFYALGGSVYNNGVVPNFEVTTNCSGLSAFSEITNGARSVTNPAPKAKYQGKRWNELLDADSAVRYYWTQEYFKNMDSSTSSTYFYKDTDTKDSMLYAGPVWDMDEAIGYDKSGSRWGYSYTSSDGWYTKNTRIYRWRANDSTMNYDSDDKSPRSFYGALATNCTDFWSMAEQYWYKYVEPATQILLGNETDSKGTLHSVDYYTQKIAKSGTMNKLRHNLDDDKSYDVATISNSMKQWLGARESWISNQISRQSLDGDEKFTVDAIPAQDYTGAAVEPELTVKYDGEVLKKGVDYTVEYSDNVLPTDSAKAKVICKGFYTGEKTVTFTINLGTLKNGSAAISATAYANDEVAVTVRDADGNIIDNNLKYQWYADGEILDNMTGSSITATAQHEGKTLTVAVTGDGIVYDGESVTSNGCLVIRQGEPEPTTYKVKFINAAGHTVSEKEYIENTSKEDIEIPANTASHFDEEKHYSYSWGEIGDVTDNATYNETEASEEHTIVKSVDKAVSCTENGIDRYACECGYFYTQEVEKTGHTPAEAVKENVSAAGYDEVVYCTACNAELSRKAVKITSPDGFAPSDKEADAAKENKSLVKINASKINTFANTKKKTLRVDFKTVKGATNYRIRYRKAGAKKWTYAWTGGKGTYTIKKLKANGLYQFQIAVYVYKNGAWQRSKYSNVNYRFMTKLTGVGAKALGKKKVKVTWTANKNASGYDVAYATKKGTKKNVTTVKGAKKKAYTLKFKKKGNYFVFVRSYKMKGGKKYTSQWTTKKIKVK